MKPVAITEDEGQRFVIRARRNDDDPWGTIAWVTTICSPATAAFFSIVEQMDYAEILITDRSRVE